MQAALFPPRSGLRAGVDEAGRGPLAGPVVAAAVILDPARPVAGLADSKALSPERRDALAADIGARALSWSVAWCDRAEIDCLNILEATMLAMRRAILGLAVQPAAVDVDGNRLPKLDGYRRRIDGHAIVRGDATVPSISAASILAKVHRDRMMMQLDRCYPGYDFTRHKGYGTAAHRALLEDLGPCPAHRRSFRPLAGGTH
mgnify:CR=1 FL=1